MTFADYIPEIISIAVSCVVLPLVMYLIDKAVEFVKQKTNFQNIDKVGEIVNNIVAEVAQSYVDGLKKQNKFDEEAQAEALQMAKDKALLLINTNKRTIIESVYGDFDTWLTSRIEAAVRMDAQKPKKEGE